MSPPTSLILQPIGITAKTIVLDQLQRLEKTRPALEREDEPNAIHDFRVALRRLRTTLRAFRGHLDGLASKRIRRDLRRLARSSAESRDLQVQRGWVADRRSELPEAGQAGAKWFLTRLERCQADADAALTNSLDQRYARVSDLIDRAFTGFGENGSLSKRSSGSTRRALRRQLAQHGEDLLQKLAAVLDVDSAAEVHEARISAKRLRYLIEPFSAELPNADDVLRRLESLQDVMGDLHDRHRTAELLAHAMRDATRASTEQEIEELLPGVNSSAEPQTDLSAARARSGLLSLARQVRSEARDLFSKIKAEWLGGRARPLIDQATALLDSEEAEADRSTEVERKYLLSSVPDRALEIEPREIVQGWLPGTKLLERLRHVRTARGDEWYRTVKSGGGLRRLEIEEPMTQQLFESLWPLTEGRRVQKRRYPVRDNGSIWEIDQFTDRNLVIAEVELPDPETKVELPSWLQQHLLREVTDEPGFSNFNLAK